MLGLNLLVEPSIVIERSTISTISQSIASQKQELSLESSCVSLPCQMEGVEVIQPNESGEPISNSYKDVTIQEPLHKLKKSHVSLFSINAPLQIEGVIRDIPLRILVDTGASLSFMSKSTATLLGLIGYLHSWNGPIVSTANGSSLEILGRIWTDIQIGVAKFRTGLLVANNFSHSVLLGNDFLMKNQAIINLCENVLTLNGIMVHFILPQMDYIVNVVNTIKIPANQMCLIFGEIKDFNMLLGFSEGLLIGNNNLQEKYGLSVAREVVTLDPNSIPISVINPYNQPVVLYKGTKLAKIKVRHKDEYFDITKTVNTITQMEERIQQLLPVGDEKEKETLKQGYLLSHKWDQQEFLNKMKLDKEFLSQD